MESEYKRVLLTIQVPYVNGSPMALDIDSLVNRVELAAELFLPAGCRLTLRPVKLVRPGSVLLLDPAAAKPDGGN